MNLARSIRKNKSDKTSTWIKAIFTWIFKIIKNWLGDTVV